MNKKNYRGEVPSSPPAISTLQDFNLGNGRQKNYTSEDPRYVFDPGRVVESLRDEYGLTPPRLYVGCLSSCWLCVRDDIRIAKFIFSDEIAEGRSVAYGLCRHCWYKYSDGTDQDKLRFRGKCEKRIASAYPNLGMVEVAA